MRGAWPYGRTYIKPISGTVAEHGKNSILPKFIYDFGYFQTARHHKKALSAALPERINGLDMKLHTVKLRGCDSLGLFLQFPVKI